jgi:hypothetical protein
MSNTNHDSHTGQFAETAAMGNGGNPDMSEPAEVNGSSKDALLSPHSPRHVSIPAFPGGMKPQLRDYSQAGQAGLGGGGGHGAMSAAQHGGPMAQPAKEPTAPVDDVSDTDDVDDMDVDAELSGPLSGLQWGY